MKPMLAACSRKQRRHMSRPYLRIRPRLPLHWRLQQGDAGERRRSARRQARSRVRESARRRRARRAEGKGRGASDGQAHQRRAPVECSFGWVLCVSGIASVCGAARERDGVVSRDIGRVCGARRAPLPLRALARHQEPTGAARARKPRRGCWHGAQAACLRSKARSRSLAHACMIISKFLGCGARC